VVGQQATATFQQRYVKEIGAAGDIGADVVGHGEKFGRCLAYSEGGLGGYANPPYVLYQRFRVRVTPTAYGILCLRLARLVHRLAATAPRIQGSIRGGG
jgi:hypothetical protein